jgi:hypothetical protein
MALSRKKQNAIDLPQETKERKDDLDLVLGENIGLDRESDIIETMTITGSIEAVPPGIDTESLGGIQEIVIDRLLVSVIVSLVIHPENVIVTRDILREIAIGIAEIILVTDIEKDIRHGIDTDPENDTSADDLLYVCLHLYLIQPREINEQYFARN